MRIDACRGKRRDRQVLWEWIRERQRCRHVGDERLIAPEGKTAEKGRNAVSTGIIVVKDSISASDNDILEPRRLVGEAKTRRKIVEVFIEDTALVLRPPIEDELPVRIHESFSAAGCPYGSRARIEIGKDAVVFLNRRAVFPAESQIERQVPRDLPIILHVEVPGGREGLRKGHAGVACRLTGQSQ